MYLRNGVPGPCGTAPYQIREGTRSRPQTDDARRLTIPGMKSRSVPVVFIAVPFVGLPCRMLNIELVTPQEVTTMETIRMAVAVLTKQTNGRFCLYDPCASGQVP